MQLTEGNFYTFRVEGKIVNISDNPFLILRDQCGTKHLIDLKPFKNYNFEEGSQITCRVDHISCSGKIYLEPPHPFYEVKKTYPFKIIDIQKYTDERGFQQAGLLLSDHFDNNYLLPCGKNKPPYSINEFINCEIFAIKKAQLFLSHPLLFPASIYKPNQKLSLHFEFETILKGKVFLIYSDDYGIFYSLEKDYYKHYHLENKPEITCNIIKFSAGGYFLIEPLHPEYTPGQPYIFKKEKVSFVFDSDGQKIELFHTSDIFGNELIIPQSETIASNENQTFQYTIQRIRKGQIYTGY